MGRNVEIKARVKDPEGLAARAERIAGEPPRILHQRDLFFAAPQGRLKLRLLDQGRGELIHYERPDGKDPKLSSYALFPTDRAEALGRLLEKALGRIGEVVKTRRLYLAGRTRIHLDRVEGLGDFMELEVVLAEGEDRAAGEEEARALMERLGIKEEDLLEGAYLDLF